VRNGERILRWMTPADYVKWRSAIGEAPPRSLLVMPGALRRRVKGVIELASCRFKPIHRVLLEKLAEGIGVVLNTIATTSRTETSED